MSDRRPCTLVALHLVVRKAPHGLAVSHYSCLLDPLVKGQHLNLFFLLVLLSHTLYLEGCYLQSGAKVVIFFETAKQFATFLHTAPHLHTKRLQEPAGDQGAAKRSLGVARSAREARAERVSRGA